MIQLLISSAGLGAIYALVGISISMLSNVTGALNFAQGHLLMLAAFLSYSFINYFSFSPIVAGVLAIILVGFFTATIFQKITYQPVKDRDINIVIVTTLGMGIVIENLVRIVYGGVPKICPASVEGIIKIGGITIIKQNILIIVSTVIIMLAFFSLLNKTRLGIVLRAVAQKPKMASLLGVQNDRIISLGFFISAIIVATAGVLIAPVFFVTIEMGFTNMIKGFCAAIIGGFGNLYGAIFGGIIIGLVEVLSATYLSSAYKDAYVFILLMLILWLKPNGLFGEVISEKI